MVSRALRFPLLASASFPLERTGEVTAIGGLTELYPNRVTTRPRSSTPATRVSHYIVSASIFTDNLVVKALEPFLCLRGMVRGRCSRCCGVRRFVQWVLLRVYYDVSSVCIFDERASNYPRFNPGFSVLHKTTVFSANSCSLNFTSIFFAE